MKRAPMPVAGVALAIALAGCGGRQSALDPAGPQAGGLAQLSWWMFGVATAVWAGVMLLLLVAALRGRRARGDEATLDHRASRNLVIVGGVLLPLAASVALVTGGAVLGRDSGGSRPPDDALRVEVTGHRWWWEVHYLDDAGNRIASLANEMHVPVGRPVRVHLKSSDVIHSFWAPNLQGKTDMIPGRTNTSWFTATREGAYRGQCGEFCGAQHAKMAFFIVAVAPPAFDAWLARQARPAAGPRDELAERGRVVFETSSCAMCHAVRGTRAMAQVAPDLTHVASRQSLAAGALPNGRGPLAAWILDPQSIKPGTMMPPTALGADDLHALLAFLGGLE